MNSFYALVASGLISANDLKESTYSLRVMFSLTIPVFSNTNSHKCLSASTFSFGALSIMSKSSVKHKILAKCCRFSLLTFFYSFLVLLNFLKASSSVSWTSFYEASPVSHSPLPELVMRHVYFFVCSDLLTFLVVA